MELHVLGPLEARVDGVALSLGTRKQQAVLALLAIHANQTVGIDEFIDELWHRQSPPPSAVSNVGLYAGNLRRLFNASEKLPDRISRRGAGFALRAEPDELDLLAFEAECRNSREAMADADLWSAVKLLSEATARWRGQMLAGLHRGPILAARCVGVEAQRLDAIEQLAEIHLALGEPHKAVPSMYEQVRAQPLRERAHELLILALHETGDAGAALAAYAAARATLAEELGIEPGPELERLHRAVLNRESTRQDRWSTAASSTEPPRSTAPRPIVPRELPAEVGYFVGRSDEARHVVDALSPREPRDRRRPAVAVVGGPGGVGKSALAVHVGHQVMDSYPDGQLYLDLLGSTPGLRPLAPLDALRYLLRSLGIPKEVIPDGEADAAARLRSITATGRFLLLLDNATGAAQVQPMLPASDTCGVIITSRHPLATIDADIHLGLDTLTSTEGLDLLRHTSGEIAIDSTVGSAIVELCGHLPLAIRIAGGRLLSRPDLAPAELARRLSERGRRLDELELEGAAVRSCIRVSYEALAVGAARLDVLAAQAIRALGTLNVTEVQPTVVAAMLAQPAPDVEAALDHLVSAKLLVARDGRYRMHDLVRLVAAELADEVDDRTTRVHMLRRAFAYYGATAERASQMLRPGRSSGPADLEVPADVPSTELSSTAEATAWLDIELPNVVDAAEQALVVDQEEGSHLTLWLACAIHHFLRERNDWSLRQQLATLALEAERAYPEHETAGWAHLIAGQAEFDLGRHELAGELLERSLAVFRSTESARGVGLALNALAITASLPPSDPRLGIDRFNECLEHARLHGLTFQEANIFANRGNLKIMLGWWDGAKADLEQSLSISQVRNDPNLNGSNECLLAVVYATEGDLVRAADYVRMATASCRSAGSSRRECDAWLAGAEIHLRRGDHEEALRHARAALALARECRFAYAEAAALRIYAEIARLIGQHATANELRAEAGAAFAKLTTPKDAILDPFLTQSTSDK